MSRVFLSHSSRDSRQAMAVKAWLVGQEPGLAEEIFLDLDPRTGIRPGERWKQALNQANTRCEAVICLLSKHWNRSHECAAEYRHAESLHKTILCARLEPVPDTGITSEWQRCDLYPDHGATTEVEIGDGGEPVVLDTLGLQRLLDALRALGIGAEHFPWPPPGDPDRAPYRGWAPLDEVDAAVFFGRDAPILRGLDLLHGMRTSGFESLFVILGPSGAGKSSFLRAGLLPRLRRDDRRFVPLSIVRPERAVLTGERGLANAIHQLRTGIGLNQPMLGEIKNACLASDVERLRGWLEEARQVARDRLLDVPTEQPAPTLVLPVDQAEELFNADAGPEAARFLELLAALVEHEAGVTPALIVAVTIGADRYEPLQIAPELAGVETALFDQLKPLPPAGYTEVITGPARRATAAGRRLMIEPALVERLLTEAAEGGDALPLLALTLERLYRDFGADGDLTVAEYEALGGMAQVVQNEVDHLLVSDPEQRQLQLDILHDAFIPWLARIDPDNNEPMRRLARWDHLPAAGHALIQAMVEKRLMVKDTRDGEVVVEIALESLLRQWRELAAWLRDEAQDLKNADSIERGAADWQASGRDDSWLLEGTRLAEAETLATKPGFRDRLTGTRDYLNTSRQRVNDRIQAEERRRQAELESAREKQRAAEALVVAETRAKQQAEQHAAALQELLCEATARRLVADAQPMLAGARSGGDVRALQQLIAAHALAPKPVEGALIDAAITRRNLLKIIDTAVEVQKVAFSSDGARVVSSGRDGSVRIWDVATGQPVGQLANGHTGPVDCVAFSPDGSRLICGGHWGGLRVWDVATGQPVGQLANGHTGPVECVAFNADGTRLASGHLDGSVRVWDVATGQPVGQPLTGHTGEVDCVAFDADGSRLICGGHLGGMRVWDAATGQPVGQPLTGHTGWVSTVAFSPDVAKLASAHLDGAVRVWDVASGQPIGQPLTGHTGEVNCVAFSQDGGLVSGGMDGSVRVWNVTGEPIGQPLTGHIGGVDCVAFSQDGARLVSSGGDGMVRIWDVASGQPVGQPLTGGHTRWERTVAFSQDGARLVSGGIDGTVWAWDVTGGQPVGQPLTGHTDWVRSVAFSPDGARFASGGDDGTVRVWDVASGQPVSKPLAGHTGVVDRVAFSQDGARLATCSKEGTVRIWDVPGGQPVGHLVTDRAGRVDCVAVSPNGGRLAFGGSDGTVRVWDVATGQPVGPPMTGHTNWVRSVAFSPDGARLVSGGSDGTVRVWDIASGQTVGPLTGHTGAVRSVAFSPDGTCIASGSDDSTVRLWTAFPDPVAALCAKLTTNMSRRQWREWVSPDLGYIKVCPDLPIAPDAAH